jgi:hypothetical protein
MRHLPLMLLALSVAACGDDDDEEAAPPPPPTIQIVAIQPAGADPWDGGSALTLGCDPERRVVVETQLENWTLQPPGTCGTSNCGYQVLRVDPESDSEQLAASAASRILVSLSALPSPTGSHTFRVELRGGISHAPATDGGEVVASQVTLEVADPPSCP